MDRMKWDMIGSVAAGWTLIGLAFCFLFMVYKVITSRNKQLLYRLELSKIKDRYDQEILEAQLEIREQVFKTISEEIHDNMGQVLSLAILNLSAINFENPAIAVQQSEAVLALVQKAVTDLRQLSHTLDADNIERDGLVRVLKLNVDIIHKSGIYQTTFEVNGAEWSLTSSQNIFVYRIAQEALQNILKHAKATKIGIHISYDATQFTLVIRDNGVGFYPIDNSALKWPGSGIRNMKKRAEIVGAEFSIESVAGIGTTIQLQLAKEDAS